MRRSLIAFLTTSCAVACAPTAAGASSLVFVDGGGDVAIARPDGSGVRKVTHATDADNGYKAVSVADDGGITAFLRKSDGSGNSTFVVLGQDGAVRQGPFLFERSGLCGGLSPFRTSTSPDGTFVAVQYWKGSDNCVGGSPTPSVRIVARNSPTVGTSTYPSYDYLTEPHWLRHPDARLAGINGGTLSVWQNDAAHMNAWVALPVGSPYELGGFDFHPTAPRMLLDVGPAGGTGVQPHRLELSTYTEMSVGAAATTDPNPQLVCAIDGYVSNDTGGGRPRWSPDGTQIAWDGPAGTYVSPAPVASGDTCVLQPKLVVPGAIASWAPFDVAADTGTGAGTGTGGGSGGPGGSTPTGGGTGKSVPVFRAAKASTATRGFRLRLQLTKATTVSVTVTRRGAKKALGTVRVRARKGTFRKTFTKVGRKRLTRGTYRVTIVAEKTRKTLSVRVKR